jgi:hypothetical protein
MCKKYVITKLYHIICLKMKKSYRSIILFIILIFNIIIIIQFKYKYLD